jgi:6-pyruvoyl-tetrahydropterin synthase related domain
MGSEQTENPGSSRASAPGAPRKRFPFVEAACLFLVSLLIMARQFASPHLASCVIDDSILQMSWVRQFSQVLSEGVWLPRWLPDSNGGHGSPVFVFYSPLVYYVTAAFQLAGSSVTLAMKFVRLLGLWFSGIAMFVFARGLAGNQVALAVALVYLVLPFHVLDISYWTLYAEPWAWIWFPLILHFLQEMLQDERNRRFLFPGVALGYAVLILTHLVSAYMFSFVMAAYTWFCSSRPKRLGNCVRLLACMGVGLALAAFFLFPAYYERRFVHLEYSTLLPEFDFRNTLLFFPNQELMASNAFLSRTVFLLQGIALLQLAGLLLGAALLHSGEKRERLPRVLWFAFWTALFCLFLMSRASIPIWEWMPGLRQIQFSTRWLSIYTLMAALLIGIALGGLAQRWTDSIVRVGFKLGLLTIGALAVVGSFMIVRGSCFLGPEEARQAEMNVYNAPEYNPRTMPNWSQRVIAPENTKWWVTQGTAKVEMRRWAAHERELSIEADSTVQLKLRLFDYPGWQMRLDGAPVAVSTDPGDGRIWVRLPPGHHVLALSFENTLWRGLSLLVSGLTAVAILIFCGWDDLKMQRPAPARQESEVL